MKPEPTRRSAGVIFAGLADKVVCTNTPRGGCPASAGLEARPQPLHPPGAAFDIVTGAAALDRGRYAPTSRIAGPSPLTVDGVPLRNELNQSYGWLTLTQALSLSVDTVFAHVGETVGRRTMSS
jgi:membrane peptidoglycan carboxypeptidase